MAGHNALYASKAKFNVFEIFLSGGYVPSQKGTNSRVKKKSQKTLILIFEVIVKLTKHTFKIGIFFEF